jgi:predicted outer membrane repeat protein
MHRKQVRAAARAAAVGGTLVLGLGTAPAAMAGSSVTVHVPCYAGALASAISGASSGETIVLAPGCIYHLNQALPDVAVDLTIVGYDTELLRDYGAPSFSLLTIAKGIGGGGGGGVLHQPLSGVDLTVVNVDFRNGGGPDDDDGGAIEAPTGTELTVHGGIFTDNYSDDYGGAIESDDTLTVTGAYFVGNFGYYEGGAIYSDGDATVYGSTFQKNSTGDDDDNYGGAIANEDYMQLAGSTFTGNTGVYGGAVYNDDDMTMTRDSLTGNAAYDGGGIYNDWNLTVYGSLIDFNWASDEGGGIYDWECASFTLTHSAVYGNVPDNIFYDDDTVGCVL